MLIYIKHSCLTQSLLTTNNKILPYSRVSYCKTILSPFLFSSAKDSQWQTVRSWKNWLQVNISYRQRLSNLCTYCHKHIPYSTSTTFQKTPNNADCPEAAVQLHWRRFYSYSKHGEGRQDGITTACTIHIKSESTTCPALPRIIVCITSCHLHNNLLSSFCRWENWLVGMLTTLAKQGRGNSNPDTLTSEPEFLLITSHRFPVPASTRSIHPPLSSWTNGSYAESIPERLKIKHNE